MRENGTVAVMAPLREVLFWCVFRQISVISGREHLFQSWEDITELPLGGNMSAWSVFILSGDVSFKG